MRIKTVFSALSLSAFGFLFEAGVTGSALANSAERRLAILDQSMKLCLAAAARPGFPYYSRPEAAEACGETKGLLHALGREANRNRNLACSGRVAAIDFDLWLIDFLGATRMRDKVSEDLRFLAKNCYNLHVRN